MRIGFGLPVSGAWATPENITSFATRAEQAGYASLWTFQRLLIPAGAEMDPVYQSVLDPVAAMAFAAATTTRIRLGVAVINAPYVAPGYLAKQATTVDVLSAGRLELGLGVGWMPEEFALTGGSMERRGDRLTEYIEVLRTLWGPQPAAFSGAFYQVPRGTTAPAPVQSGGPPILLGGLAPRALRRAGRLADGWVTSSRTDLSAIAQTAAVVRDAAAEAGRDPAAIRIICRGAARLGDPLPDGHGGRKLLSGGISQIRADADWLAGQGVTELFYDLNWDPLVGAPDLPVRAATDRAAHLIEALAPAA